MTERELVAIGRLTPEGPWVGLARTPDGWRLACAAADGTAVTSASEGADRTDELLSAAITYFEEVLAPPPPELEATQADLANMLRWLSASEPDRGRRALLDDAVDAVDDGLAGDAVVGRLAEARAPAGRIAAQAENEQADPVSLLAARCGSTGVTGSAPSIGAGN